uniref:Spermine spermidine synthase n=1 Tax=Tetraselmis sp. GSL018 TaxID=582737 RepID=A0A061SIP4_9CHLO
MKLDHSLLGGVYVRPEELAGESVYSAFHVQEAVLLAGPARRPAPRALVVGLGPGLAAKGLQDAGVAVDVMELHGEVVQAAEKFFGWRPNGRVWVRDAVASLAMLLRSEPSAEYDYILHDICSGGVMDGSLLTAPFFSKLSKLLAPDGVVAVNYFGGADPNLHLLGRTLLAAFGHLRCVGDEHDGEAARNFVLFASRRPVVFRQPQAEDFRGSAMREDALATLSSREVALDLDPSLGELDGASRGFDPELVMQHARRHWQAMREVLPGSFWSAAL